jgi:hypothetical protein
MVPGSFVDRDHKLADRNLVGALLRSFRVNAKKGLEEVRGSFHPERGTGKSHRRAIAAKKGSHDREI